MIHCINCGHVNAEGASQCEACYEPLPAVTSCPTCQASVPDDAFFCPQCGASLPRGVANQPDTPNVETPGSPLAPSLSDLPPTNVVAQQSLGVSPIPPTNVVNPSVSSDLPPTNVVNPSVSSDLPPTNVVNYVPETMPPQSPPVSSELPPTNVVHPLPQELESVDSTSESELSESTSSDNAESQREIETVPTMVVSPSSDRDVVDAPLPPPPEEPTTPPFVPPTVPPQSPPSYQPPQPVVTSEASSTNLPFPGEVSISTPPETIPEPTTETLPIEEPLSESNRIEQAVLPLTTVQPKNPQVGETVIQRPPARLIHERTNTTIPLPTNLEVILLGKKTSAVIPDIDVLGFVDSDVVSRRHAAIFVNLEGYFIEDLGSSNGTYVNDVQCAQGDRMPITSGDRICLGRENKVSFIFQIG